MYKCPNISHVHCKYENFKVCTFCQILCFSLKNYHNFESYQNMLNILHFSFLYHKLQLCFIYYVHYTPSICDKPLLKI